MSTHDRRTYLGGGDIAALMGLSQYRTPLDVYNAKVSETAAPELLGPHIQRGNALEPLVLDMLAERGADLTRDFHVISSARPEFAGTLDAIRKEDGIPVAVVEVKCPTARVYRRLLRDGLPMDYIAQVQWYMGLTALPKAEVTLFCADEWELSTLIIPRDDEFIGILQDEGERFWRDHVVPRVPPTDESGRAAKGAVASIERTVATGLIDMDGDVGFAAALQTFLEAKDAVSELESIRDEAKEKLLAMMPAIGTYRAGPWSVRLSATKGRTTVDSKLLREKYPHVAKEVEKTGAGGVSLTVKSIAHTPAEEAE